MKTDRLLEIIIYLLNHESVTAKQLADKFNVSIRTIQRDMNNISLAGIPLLSVVGSQGGYLIAPDYKIRNQFINKEDFTLIVMALKSLNTAYDNSQLEIIMNKYKSLSEAGAPNVFLDYSVTKENANVLLSNKKIEDAISASVQIRFDYRNSQGSASSKIVCPLALRFKWYAWYLFAYDPSKNDYRTYKVARTSNIAITDIRFQKHDNIEKTLLASEEKYLQTCENIEVWCRYDAATALEEYFPGEKKERLEDDNYILHLRVPPNEKLWQALLLSMGDSVKILKPEYYKNQLIRTAVGFLANYDIHMS